MTDRSKLPYRPCAGAALFNAAGEVFIGRRRPKPGQPERSGSFEWQMPQGGIDEGEDPRQAAIRELYEETNVRSIEFLAEAPEWYSYDLPEEMVGGGWTKHYRGQIQKWFAFRFTGPESEIDVQHPGGGHSRPEFDQWRWEKLEKLPEIVIPFKLSVYRNVVAAFRPFAA
jgi:putative (di)nucleoside polyphosphate hydrolase